jgi:hypothetical protein
MAETALLFDGVEGKARDLELELVDVCGQLHWFCGALEADNLNAALVLRGITRQLEALVERVADQEVRS